MDVVGEPIRVLAHQPGGIMAIGLPNAARVGFAEPDVSEPRVDVGDGGYLGERLADRPSAIRGDALDDAQVLWTVSEDLEYAVAETLERFRCADRPEVGGVSDKERDDPAAVQAIDQLEGVDPHLPAELRMTGPDAADPHHGLQRDLCWQLAQRPYP
jgi:hypothetical protein